MIARSRGLRQGDPLSPYLFVLCMECLGHWIGEKLEEGRLKPLKATRNGPGMSYLFFADDLLFFSEAMVDQVGYLMEGLRIFCRASGQKVNFNKSSMFFSLNMPVETAVALSEGVGIPRTCHLGKYLGHHLLHHGRNRDAHMDLVELIKRMEGWKLRCLSRAGRLTLAQSVLGSIPIFYMQMERLSAWVHKELDRAMRRCVWGKRDGSRGVHMLGWEGLTKPKRLGGASR